VVSPHRRFGSVEWGEPRLTQDINIVIDRGCQERQRIELFIDAVQTAGFYFEAKTVRHTMASGKPFQLLEPVEVLKLNVYSRRIIPGEWSRSVLAEVFPGSLTAIASRPDSALSKLIWISRGSHKRRRDLRRKVQSLSDLESTFPRTHSVQLQLENLLDSVLVESDEIPE
jgi:hypothetical protein